LRINVTVCEGRGAGVFCAVTNKRNITKKARRKKRAVWIGKIAERKRSNFVYLFLICNENGIKYPRTFVTRVGELNTKKSLEVRKGRLVTKGEGISGKFHFLLSSNSGEARTVASGLLLG
jgi:hypothetical protein